MSSTAPINLSIATCSSMLTIMVSSTRKPIAAPLPSNMACFIWRGGNLRHDSAITTALSPDSIRSRSDT